MWGVYANGEVGGGGERGIGRGMVGEVWGERCEGDGMKRESVCCVEQIV